MSLRIGVVRVGWGGAPLLDLLIDTTDSDRALPAFCHVAFNSVFSGVVAHLTNAGVVSLGTCVRAY
jgi:hypothetical protein